MATGRGPAASGGYASRVVLHPRKLETNVTLEFAKLNIKLISPFTKMATNKNIISILSSYVRSTELGGTCFYVRAETLSLESPFPKLRNEVPMRVQLAAASNVAGYGNFRKCPKVRF